MDCENGECGTGGDYDASTAAPELPEPMPIDEVARMRERKAERAANADMWFWIVIAALVGYAIYQRRK